MRLEHNRFAKLENTYLSVHTEGNHIKFTLRRVKG